MLRNGLTGDWIGTFVGHKGAVWGCCLDKNALRCATASADFSARVFDAVSGDELACLPHSHIVRTVAFAPDGRSLVTGGYEKLLRVYDLSSLPASASAAAAKASALAEAPPPPAPLVAATAPDKIRRALFNADGLLLTSYIDAPGLGVWDLRSGKCVKTLETGCVVSDFNFAEGGEASSSGASPSPSSAPSSSSTLVVAGGKAASIYDASTFSLVKSFGFDFGINSAAFEPARSRVVAGGDDMWCHLLDSKTGEELEACRGHHGPIHALRFAPGGATYASGSEDGTIRLWSTDWVEKHAEDAAAEAAAAAAASAAAAAAAASAAAAAAEANSAAAASSEAVAAA